MNFYIGHAVWMSYSSAADEMIDSAQEYNPLMDSYEHMLPGGAGRPVIETRKGTQRTMATNDAIGLLETQGLVGLLEGADAMCKSAGVEIIGKEKLGGGYITVLIRGDVAAVTTAIEAGAEAVIRVGGKLILSHVIARPHDELAALLPA